jgi:cytochrome P450
MLQCLKSEETPHIIETYKYIIKTVEDLMRLIFPWITKLPTAHNKKFLKAIEEFDGFIFDIIEKKRNDMKNNIDNSYNGRADLLTSMLKLGEQEGITTDTKQLRDEMVTFFIAGHDSKFESSIFIIIY